MAEQQGTDPQAVQGLWEVDQQEAALPRDGGSPAAQEEPALSPEANNMDDGEEADRQQIPQQGRPVDCEIEEKEGKKFQVKNSVDRDQRAETGQKSAKLHSEVTPLCI